ncbi:hypothetical protein PSCICF_31300 [Pseudomonas cichorii]|nr:hypothetical protein PSCICF_31300 [Pseudomonas cichorii]
MLADQPIYGQRAVGCYAGLMAGTVPAALALTLAQSWMEGPSEDGVF